MRMARPLRLEILCLTMPSRTGFLARLRGHLEPQVAEFDDVAFTVTVSDPSLSLGENREVMRQAATGDYICFHDDDDLPADDYVARIRPLLDGVDQIGFELRVTEDGVPQRRTYHSLLCGGWRTTEWAYYRDISHINPMRRELALAAPMWGDFGEDSRWASELRAKGIVRTEHYIDDVMYHYQSRTDKTDGVSPGRVSVGECAACGSRMTVMSGEARFCNACGGIF